MHIFHKWGKWQQYDQPIMQTFLRGSQAGKSFESVECWQKRSCEICGKAQQEEIKGR